MLTAFHFHNLYDHHSMVTYVISSRAEAQSQLRWS